MSRRTKPARDLAALGSIVLIAAVVVAPSSPRADTCRHSSSRPPPWWCSAAPPPPCSSAFRSSSCGGRPRPCAAPSAASSVPTRRSSRGSNSTVRIRRRGPAGIEGDIATVEDPFLSRALGLVVDDVDAHEIRRALTTFSRATEEADEGGAIVLETAAGYAPTLGILHGAVLGLIRVMENLATPASVRAGIAVAFVATVYGVGSANTVLLPLASRLRALSRQAAVDRELITEGAVVLRQALHPRIVLEAHMGGFIRSEPVGGKEGAA
ncbi:MAG: MotA/TolQ/ExbB proton channel family protein [Vicinamibacterales bacterium]